jgi:hypothetical protein
MASISRNELDETPTILLFYPDFVTKKLKIYPYFVTRFIKNYPDFMLYIG